MNKFNEFIDRYVAVWHEQDPAKRPGAIAELWMPDGAQILESRTVRGYDALQQRVAQVYDDFIGPGTFVFRSGGNEASYSNVGTFNWHMVAPGSDTAAAVGFDFFIFSGDSRILVDYQFIDPPEPSDELNEFAGRYLELWGMEAHARGRDLGSIWTDDAQFLQESGTAHGRTAIEAELARMNEHLTARGLVLRSLGNAQTYQNNGVGERDVIRFSWQAQSAEDNMITSGFDFLMRDKDKIRVAYRFAWSPLP